VPSLLAWVRPVCLAALLVGHAAAAPWIAADWAGKEPQFPPGSLHFQTNVYKHCPVLYRAVLQVPNRPVQFAGLRVRASWYDYVYLNGREIARHLQKGEGAVTNPLDVELTHLLRPGPNVLIVSTTPEGFSLEGGVACEGGKVERFGSDTDWRVQKFAPLTMLEHEPCMRPDFDASEWFHVKRSDREPVALPNDELALVCQRLGGKRMQQLDLDAHWRLKMLAEKGIAVTCGRPLGRMPHSAGGWPPAAVDWEARGWAGPARLAPTFEQFQASAFHVLPGFFHHVAEAMTRYVWLSDEATNLANQAIGLKALGAADPEVAACDNAARALRALLSEIEPLRGLAKMEKVLALATEGEAIAAQAHKVRVINDLCSCLDNKFGWIDSNRLIGNDIGDWGLRVNPVETSWKMNLDGKWRFKTDPDNVGLAEKRHTFGYNIENQWPELNVPGAWEDQGVMQANPNAVKQSPYPGVNERTDGPYNGFAWYRKTLTVPKEWAGNDLELYISVIDDWDWAYFNDKEIGHTGAKTKGWWHAATGFRRSWCSSAATTPSPCASTTAARRASWAASSFVAPASRTPSRTSPRPSESPPPSSPAPSPPPRSSPSGRRSSSSGAGSSAALPAHCARAL